MTPQNALVANTTLPNEIKAKFNLVLLETKYQQLLDEKGKLVFNEDNIPQILEFIKKNKDSLKKVSETHKLGKEEAKKVCDNWDLAKRLTNELYDSLISEVEPKLRQIIQDVETRKAKQAADLARIAVIKNGIEQNKINFATRISNCNTLQELLAIERVINLEKGNLKKYQEFADDAKEAFTTGLTDLLTKQKIKVKELEEIKAKELAAIEQNNDAVAIELQEKKDQVQNEIEQNKILVQESAAESFEFNTAIPIAEEVFVNVSAKRTTWKFELVDTEQCLKKSAHLLDITLNKDKAKEMLNTLKATDQLKGKTEITVNGVRFYEEKTYS